MSLKLKLFIGSVLALVLVAVISLLANTDNSSPSSADQQETETSGVNTLPAPTTPTTPTESTPEEPVVSGPLANTPEDAAVAAGEMVVRLSGAQFVEAEFRAQEVNELVIPAQRSFMEQALAFSGNVLAEQWNYADAAEALVRANFYTSPLMWRVEKFGGGKARVAIYAHTAYTQQILPTCTPAQQTLLDLAQSGTSVTESLPACSPEGQEVQEEVRDPTVTIIDMMWDGDRWLYVTTPPTPKSLVAPTGQGVSFEETVARYQPLLEGFHDF